MGMTAMTLAGPIESMALRQDLNTWLRQETEEGSCRLNIAYDPSLDVMVGKGRTPGKNSFNVKVQLERENGRVSLASSKTKPSPDRHIWSTGSGWFFASFGPSRRFTGGNREYEKLFYQYPRLAPHLSIFGEDVALTESLTWLKTLNHRLLDYRSRKDDLKADEIELFMESLKQFINGSGLLPHAVQLVDITADDILFADGNGCRLLVVDLSDGYRNVLSLTFELLRQLSQRYGSRHLFDADDPSKVAVPGVVLSDEIDVHLHPTWQHKIGRWFRTYFPKIQFLVTTHSTLVCQAADHGSVWQLPGSGQEMSSQHVTGSALDRLLYGNILDAYATGLFGKNTTRSPESQEKLRRLAVLNMKSLEEDLSTREFTEQQSLGGSSPLTPYDAIVCNHQA